MYRVIWRYAVIDRLTQFYTDVFARGGDTAAITRAADQTDRLLRANPAEQGESRAAYLRVLIVEPLTVMYEVYEDEQTVFVLGLVYHTRR